MTPSVILYRACGVPVSPGDLAELGLQQVKPAGYTDLAIATGLSRQRILAILRKPGAPPPLAMTSGGPMFDETEALAFIRAKRPPGRPRNNAERAA